MQPKYSLESPTGGTQCPSVRAGLMEESLLHNMAASTMCEPQVVIHDP